MPPSHNADSPPTLVLPDGALPDQPTSSSDIVDWDRVAASSGFRALVRAKLRFIVPATIFFIIYFFALPVMVGYAPDLMNRKVIGPVNVAYLFALSQFFMTWIVALIYVRAASRHDRMARQIVNDLEDERGGQ